MPRLTFSGDAVGLIVRGMTGPTHDPGVMEQHADCILSNGSCVGFFGEGRDGSSGASGSVGLNLRGTVYDMDSLARHRPYYIDASTARAYGVHSTVLVLRVGAALAAAFDAAWSGMAEDPPSFWLAGANCSTRASGAFRESGILSGGIPGLDTPVHLYRQLQTTLGPRAQSHSGFVGFERSGAGYAVVVATNGS